MTIMKRIAPKVWNRAGWLSGLLLAVVLAGCTKDPVEPQPVAPEPTFSKTFVNGDFKAAFQISGGGYVAAGTGADNQGYIYKLDPNGNEVAHYVFDQNASAETVSDVLPVDGGGYMVCGSTSDEGWVAKIDGQLQNVQNNLYRGSAREDHLAAMAPRTDGGFVVGGEYDWDRTWSTGDGWLMRVSSSGAYEGQNSFGGTSRDYVLAITPSGDGGFFFGGATFPSASADGRGWICKANATGTSLHWDKSYLFDRTTVISGIAATSGGGCICVGGTTRMETSTMGASDGYILKVDANGEKLWSNRTEIDGPDSYSGVVPAHDGGYVCVGVLYDTGSARLVKIDENGNAVWEKSYPGGRLYSIKQTAGKGYVCSGTMNNQGWLLKVDINGNS